MSAWIKHVKDYQQANGVTYKKAMTDAKASYKTQQGGSMKSIGRKIKNTLNKSDVVGRKAKNTIETVTRKARNTGKKVSEYADELLPAVTAFVPEAGVALAAANATLKEVVGSGVKRRGRKLGSKNGGSFKTTGAGVNNNMCTQCGGAVGHGRSSSSILSHTHNAFNPIKPKPVSVRMRTN